MAVRAGKQTSGGRGGRLRHRRKQMTRAYWRIKAREQIDEREYSVIKARDDQQQRRVGGEGNEVNEGSIEKRIGSRR